MATTCEMCGENVASVFTPTMALCKPCKRESDRMDLEDNEIPNQPTCAVDGSVLISNGSCLECVDRAVRIGHAAMARVS